MFGKPITIAFITTILLAGNLFAGTWVPTIGGNWNTPGNWSDNTVPNAVGATATLANSLGNQTINLSAPVTIGTLNAATNFVSGNWTAPLTFTGQTITFNNNGNGASLDMSPTGNNRRLVFNNSFVLNDNLAITNGSDNIVLNGGASGAGNILSSGYGVELGGDFSNWSGDLSGNVTIKSTGTFGDGNGTLRSADVRRSTQATLTLNYAISVPGSIWFRYSNPSPVHTILTTDSISLGQTGKISLALYSGYAANNFVTEFTGNIDLTGTNGIELWHGAFNANGRNIVVFNNSSGTQSVSRITSTDAGGDVVRGPGGGTTIITGASTYGGTTKVTGGRLLVNGTHAYSSGRAGDYTVVAGVLGGSGTITADVVVQSGGTLSPGNSIGTLTVLGTVDLDGGTLRIEYDGTGGADLLAVDGLLDLVGGTLALSQFGGGPIDRNAPHIIATYGSRDGTFANIVGGYLSIDYDYNGNSIAVYIPEPSALFTLLSLVGCMASRRARLLRGK